MSFLNNFNLEVDRYILFRGTTTSKRKDLVERITNEEKIGHYGLFKRSDSKISRFVENAAHYSMLYIEGIVKISALVVAAAILHYEITHQTIKETRNNKGEIVYEHPDSQTDMLLNYIAGRRTLTEEERIGLTDGNINTVVSSIAEDHKITLPPDFENKKFKSIGDIKEYIISNSEGKLKNKEDTADVISRVNDYFKDFPAAYSQDPKLYDLLWKLEKEVGAPCIAGTQSRSAIKKKMISITNMGELDSYTFQTNTIYSSDLSNLENCSESDFQSLVAEMAHSKQVHDDYVGFGFSKIKTLANTCIMAISEGVSLEEAYDNAYDKPGSFEFEAHKVIEPVLFARFKELQPGVPRE